jgi:hypothetical protein
MRFAPVWISSRHHLEELGRIYRESNVLRGYRMPEGFPHLRFLYLPFVRIPIVYFATGVMEIGDGHVSFHSVPRSIAGSSIRDVRHPWRFDFPCQDLLDVEDDEMSSPVHRSFNLPFVRVRTRQAAPLDELLLCVGGSGFAWGRIRRQTQLLHDALRASMPGAVRVESRR